MTVQTATERSRSRLVRRAHLTSRLVSSADTPVVLIDAPAGFGKSTALQEWQDVDPRPFAGLTLTSMHDDPVLLTASIAGAVAEHAPVAEEVYSALIGSGSISVAVPRLLESLAAADGPLVLTLDDAHAVRDEVSLDLVAAIASGLPEGSQLVLAARRPPPIHLGRLRANRGLVEFGTEDLAFTGAEAAELFESCGLQLSAASIEVLVARTEGWPAALYLAALSLQGSPDPDGDAQQFAGDDRLVSDYLRDELVSALDGVELDFLTRSSILDEVSGDVCDAVLETEGAAQTLAELARSNALVVPLDGKDRAFRYHALLREMLAAELQRRHPADEAKLHARASSWFAGRGDFDRAVPHSIATGDVALAAQLIWSQTAHYASVGRWATLELWLGEFSGPQVDADPRLCLVRATCTMTAGDGAATEHWTRRTLHLVADSEAPAAVELRLVAKAIRAASCARESAEAMRADAAAAYELMPEHSPWRALCRFVEGAALHIGGDPAAARSALEDGIRRGDTLAPSLYALCAAQLALLALDEGDAAEAAHLIGAALNRAEVFALTEQPTQALVLAVGGFLAARGGDAAAASRRVKRATTLLGELNDISAWYDAETRIVLARAQALLDDVAAARGLLGEAGRRLRQAPDARVLREWLELAWREADLATVADRWPLTPAELRLLHHLPTHLSFPEIAEESFVSQNTVKTQARSIYRKLGVSSRAEAVAVARTAGLLSD